MTQERHKVIISGYLILIKNKKILLSRRFQTGYEDGKYSVPAGHMEKGESIKHGTIREIYEEIGLTVDPDDLECIHVMHRKHFDERVDFFFSLKNWKGKIENKEPNKCDDLQWFYLNQLPTNIIPYIKYAIEASQKHIFYSEFGWK